MMKKKILVLGAGLVGGPIALDLAADEIFEVTVADLNKNRLALLSDKGMDTLQLDAADAQGLSDVLKDYRIVVNATPGFIGFRVLRNCIEAGKDVIDIAFYPENPFDLNEPATEKGVKVICDMGVAPGMSNLLTGYAASKLSKTDTVKIYVGGLPKIRQLPWEYKAVFSPADVIEEYTRPARVVENGHIVVKEPLTEIELLDFERPGTLEAFNSDGLRSLLFTIKAENMVEKTLRYPGYTEKIKLLAQNGFLSNEKLDVNGIPIAPIDLTAKLLFDQWKLKPGEEDITVMRIEVSGTDNHGHKKQYIYDLYDEYDLSQGVHSMARTTGYSASMAVRALAANLIKPSGIIVPEQLGEDDEVVSFILNGLKQRGITYEETINEI